MTPTHGVTKLKCLHPDRSASDAVLARTFDEMRKREKVLRAK